jgi:hypothetical protein
MPAPDSCEALVDAYVSWLRQKYAVTSVGNFCEISTPFLDHHNDHIEVYVRRLADGSLVLTDGGDVIRDLAAGGVDVNSISRRRMLATAAEVRGVAIEGEELTVRSTPEDFPKKKHALMQAMLAIGDLYITSRERVRGLFLDDVRDFLREHSIAFVPSVKIPGRSGFDHYADFVIPGIAARPERILQTVPDPNRQAVSLLLFMWQDIRGHREGNTRAYAMLNDEERDPSEAAAALTSYEISPLRWSRRQEAVHELAA